MALRRITNTRHYKLITPIDTPGIYHNSDLGLISISSDGSTWLTIADKNLGATQVYNDGDTLSEANCGKYYQWGNNYGFPFTGPTITSSTRVDATNYGPGNYYSSSTYIVGSYQDRSTVENTNLRGGDTGTNEAMQGPCPTGFHVPKNTELQSVIDAGISLGAWVSGGGANFTKYIKIPLGGFYNSSATNSYVGTTGYYWSSNYSEAYRSYGLRLQSNTLQIQSTANRINGFQIRPFKNDAVQPDDSRTKLY